MYTGLFNHVISLDKIVSTTKLAQAESLNLYSVLCSNLISLQVKARMGPQNRLQSLAFMCFSINHPTFIC
jgi:hypothetical protein